MRDDILQIEGCSGGGNDEPPYVPVESPNTLQSKSVYRVIELIGEGEIEGLVNGYKSIFVNDVPLQNADGSYNFQGITIHERTGILGQDPIPGFPASETPRSVGIEMSVATGPVTQTVTDPNVDAIYVMVTIPALYESKDNGDMTGSTVSFSIQINGDTPVTKVISDKCVSSAQLNYRIALPEGQSPWSIKLTRITPDSATSKIQNATHWTSYTEIIDHKIEYRNSAVIAAELDAELFGDQIPQRSYLERGLKIMLPSGYTPPLKDINGVWQPAIYPDTWDGTWQSARYSNNPPWCLYDLLINNVYGARLPDPSSALKWALYPIAQRCDELIDDGFGGLEPRYHLNCCITNQQEAYALIGQLIATFHGMSWWGPGSVFVSQDAPLEPRVLATPANVIGGEFTYEGSALKTRNTVCMVTYNDPADHYRPAIEVVEDKAALLKYGYKPIEIAPIGCTSRGLAHRLGRWALDTPLTATQTVSYVAGLDHAYVVPGEIVAVADPFYANTELGGLLVAVNGTTVKLDRKVTLAAGETYDLYCTMPDGSLESRVVTTISDDLGHQELDIITAFSDTPQVESVWTVTGTDVAPRLFTVLSNTEVDVKGGIGYQISGLFYDPTKFARIEDNIILETPDYSKGIGTGVILPPNNAQLLLKTYYADGQLQNMLVFSWEAASDARVTDYRVQYKVGSDGSWQDITANGYLAELMEVQTNHYYFRMQSISRTGATSLWVYTDLDVTQASMPDVTGLKLVDGATATTFNGGDAKFSWDAVASSSVPSAGGVDAWFESYVVEVVKNTVVVRTEYPKTPDFAYSYSMNKLDGGPDRNFEIRVYQKGNLGQISSTPATLAVSNPAPSMAGFTPVVTDSFKGVLIDWNSWSTTDTDFSSFKIYVDLLAVPTALVQEVSKVTKRWLEPNLTVGQNYKVKIVPTDAFGDGTASEVGNGTPLILPGTDVDVNLELSGSILMSDSDGSTQTELDTLYDRVTDFGGITYTITGVEKFIQYKFPLEDYIDQVVVHCGSTPAQAYIRYTSDGQAWNYLEAETDHTLTTTGDLVAGTSGSAPTNFWQLAAGLNVAKFPQRSTAKYCELVMVGNYTTTIFELVFDREVIAERIVADNLAVISAYLGTILGGLMISPNWVSSGGIDGMMIDLVGELIKISQDIILDGPNRRVVIGNDAGMSGEVTAGNDIRFWAGGTPALLADANFIVRKDGSVKIQSAATGSRTVFDKDTYEVWDGDVLRVKLGNLS